VNGEQSEFCCGSVFTFLLMSEKVKRVAEFPLVLYPCSDSRALGTSLLGIDPEMGERSFSLLWSWDLFKRSS